MLITTNLLLIRLLVEVVAVLYIAGWNVRVVPATVVFHLAAISFARENPSQSRICRNGTNGVPYHNT